MENKSIMRATYIFVGLFLIMAVYFSYYLGMKSDEQMNNSYNKLTGKLGETTVRGKIYSSDGKVLAETVTDDDGRERRSYPYNELFCHVVGTTAYGQSGLEAVYDYQLLMSDSSWVSKLFTDLKGKKYEGNNIITTLDTELQKAAFDAMSDYKGAVVIMEADTGKVITMMSNPSYNPNTLREQWDTISADKTSPLVNRATMGLYTPGSIFKLFTLEEYLEEGGQSSDYIFNCTGAVQISGKNISCANGHSHGTVDLTGSFSNSCNGSFINIGSSLKNGSLKKLCDRMLFNSHLPIKLPYNKSSFSLADDADDFLKAQTYFGQGETLCTPVHMALICSAIANDGVIMEPMFVERIENAYGKTVESFEPKEYKTIFSKVQAENLKPYLRSVVEKGTAIRLNDFKNLTVYGKTGTAQTDNGNKSNSWFIGFFEKDGKSYSIAVVCEDVPGNVSPSITVTKDILKTLD
ncbi:MAG: penicillin-binding protein 2 [Lachnospiraceae bacterium]